MLRICFELGKIFNFRSQCEIGFLPDVAFPYVLEFQTSRSSRRIQTLNWSILFSFFA